MRIRPPEGTVQFELNAALFPGKLAGMPEQFSADSLTPAVFLRYQFHDFRNFCGMVDLIIDAQIDVGKNRSAVFTNKCMKPGIVPLVFKCGAECLVFEYGMFHGFYQMFHRYIIAVCHRTYDHTDIITGPVLCRRTENQ